jgi:putative glutamine amidotransferase
MSLPIIGLTCTRERNQNNDLQNRVAEAYTRAVQKAGGIPILIPLGSDEKILGELAARLDGILLTGGGDIRPSVYGHQMHPLVDGIDPDRDRVELALFPEVTQRRLPFLGICRGLQAINVAMGGTLYEDILDQMPGAQRHAWGDEKPRDYQAHPVRLDEKSRLRGILGAPEVGVNSLHHQGICDLAPEIIASAWAPDGLVEAIELPGYPFGLAVQWHPECMPDDERMQALFQAFVEEAKGTRDRGF